MTEITLTSGLDTFDLSGEMTDFSPINIFKILGNYFNLVWSTELSQMCERLSGPPKLVYFFLKAAAKYPLISQTDLLEKWHEIERVALGYFKDKIRSTFRGDLDIVARRLCLLHLSAVALKQDFVDISVISRHLVYLIEAGLLRVRQHGPGWRVFAPNRFLVQIFAQHVRWYTLERLQMLTSLNRSSAATTTQNGKVFEWMFGIELCNSPDCKLWTFLSERVGLQPLPGWNPVMTLSKHLSECTDHTCLYVMVDPDRDISMVDLVFFASILATGDVVRVLVQLTISSSSVLTKMKDSFNQMLRHIAPMSDLNDYRIFVGPNSNTVFSASEERAYNANYLANRCYAFLNDSLISDSFELPFKLLCDPKSTEKSLAALVEMAEELGDSSLANQLAGEFGSLTMPKKRPRFNEKGMLKGLSVLKEFYNDSKCPNFFHFRI
jgi:hypothetical protein